MINIYTKSQLFIPYSVIFTLIYIAIQRLFWIYVCLEQKLNQDMYLSVKTDLLNLCLLDIYTVINILCGIYLIISFIYYLKLDRKLVYVLAILLAFLSILLSQYNISQSRYIFGFEFLQILKEKRGSI